MPEIHVNVREKIAQTVGAPEIVCGNSDYIAVFDLDSEWDDYDLKTAHFKWVDVRSGKMMEYELTFSGTLCSIPAIYGTHLLLIGIYAGNIRTTTAAKVPCIRCITDDGSGESGHPAPQPDIYEQLLEAIEQIEPQPQPSPQRTVTAALDVPYYTGITQDASPKGVSMSDVVYGTPNANTMSTFYFAEQDPPYDPPRAVMYYSSADLQAFSSALQSATGFYVQTGSTTKFGTVCPYDANESPSNPPRVELFHSTSNYGYIIPRIFYGTSSNAISLQHQKGEMVYDSEARYCTDGPILYYQKNTSGNLLLLGIGSGTPSHMDILLDKEHHLIVFLPDSGNELHILTESGLFKQSLDDAVTHNSFVSLAPLIIPELGISIPDVYLSSVSNSTLYSRQFTNGNDVFVSSGNAASNAKTNFVMKL